MDNTTLIALALVLGINEERARVRKNAQEYLRAIDIVSDFYRAWGTLFLKLVEGHPNAKLVSDVFNKLQSDLNIERYRVLSQWAQAI